MRTSLTAWLVSFASVLILVGLTFRAWPLLVMALVPAAFLALGSAWRPSPPVLAISRSVERDRFSVGQRTRVRLRIENLGNPLDLVEIRDHVPPQLRVHGSNHLVASLRSGRTIELTYELEAVAKGEVSLGPTFARSHDPLGLEVHDAEGGGQTSLFVAPKMEDLRRAKIVPRRVRGWFGQVSSRRPGIGTDFWSLRPYEAGDDMRRINWKATARTGRLISNEHEGERSGDVVIVVDARLESEIGPVFRGTVEYGIRAAVGIAAKALSDRNRVGLIVQREVLSWVYPAFGRRQLYRIVDALVNVRPGGEWPFEQVAWVLARFFPPNCHIILISPMLDRSSVRSVENLAAMGFALTVVSPSPVEVEMAMYAEDVTLVTAHRVLRMERDNAVATLRRTADVVDWDPRQPLAVPFRGVRAYPRVR